VVEGLICRAELYEETVRYYETGQADGEVAEVLGVEEARALAEMYRSLTDWGNTAAETARRLATKRIAKCYNAGTDFSGVRP